MAGVDGTKCSMWLLVGTLIGVNAKHMDVS